MQLSDEKYKIVWCYHGFKSTDLTEWQLKRYQDRFMKMWDAFEKWAKSTEIFDKLNAVFEVKHCGADCKNDSLASYMYGNWICYQINKCLWDRDHSYTENLAKIGLDDWDLQPIMFMNGTIPDFGVAFRHHEGWTMSILLEPIE